MKNLFYYLFVLFFVAILGSCDNINGNKQEKATIEEGVAVLTFEKTNHNFGTVIEGEKVTYSFRFTNNGDASLMLTSVGTSCGCTASNYSHDAIEPGKSSKIQITFNSANRLGMQHKKITIRSNTDPEFTVLDVYAQVIEKEIEN